MTNRAYSIALCHTWCSYTKSKEQLILILVKLFWVTYFSIQFQIEISDLFFHRLTKRAKPGQIPSTDQGQNEAEEQATPPPKKRAILVKENLKQDLNFEMGIVLSFDIPETRKKSSGRIGVGWKFGGVEEIWWLLTLLVLGSVGCPRVEVEDK